MDRVSLSIAALLGRHVAVADCYTAPLFENRNGIDRYAKILGPRKDSNPLAGFSG
jgi:hypothetical protein